MHRLTLVLQLKAEVLHPSLERERRGLVPAVEHESRCTRRCVLPHERERNRRPLDRGARIPIRIGEKAQHATHRTPAPGHACLGNPRLCAVCRLLVDHEVERLYARQQIDKPVLDRLARHRHRVRQRQANSAIDARHRQRRIFNRLDQHTTTLGPRPDALVEKMARQSIHLAHESAFVKCFRVDVVRREIVAAAHDETSEIAVLARHPVQRLDPRHHGHIGQQRVVAVHEQLRPRPVHRHGLHRLAVPREPPVLDDTARLEQTHRFAITQFVERHGQVERVGAHAKVRTGHRHTLAVARQLKLRRRWPQRGELDVAVGQNEHAPARHAAVHTPGHLEYLVGAEMEPREHIAPAVHDVRKTRIVDDHSVEPAHVQRTLPSSRHRQEVRLGHLTLEKRPDHADRLAAVIELRCDLPVARANICGHLLHARARGKKHSHAPLLPLQARQELVVEKTQRMRVDHLHVSRHRRIKRGTLDHRRGVQIARIERRIYRR